MTVARSNPEFLNGVPELLLLKLLDRQPMHGYELLRAIEKATSQTLKFGEGCIYPILHRLEQQGSLMSRREIVGSRTRLVYQVTTKGREKLVESISSWHASSRRSITRWKESGMDIRQLFDDLPQELRQWGLPEEYIAAISMNCGNISPT